MVRYHTIILSVVGGVIFFIIVISICITCQQRKREERRRQHTLKQDERRAIEVRDKVNIRCYVLCLHICAVAYVMCIFIVLKNLKYIIATPQELIARIQ